MCTDSPGVVDDLLRLTLLEGYAEASRTSSVRGCSIGQPTMRRLNAYRTTARYRKPSPVGTWVMSAQLV